MTRGHSSLRPLEVDNPIDIEHVAPRYYFLGIALLILALLYPVLEFEHMGLILWTSVFWVMLIAAVRATNHTPTIKKATYCFGGVVILLGIAGMICYQYLGNSHAWIFTSINFVTFVFLAFVTSSVIYNILSSSRIGIDHLIGAASAYVLIGITFAYSYIVLHSITGSALLHSEIPLPLSNEDAMASLVADYCYFSFATLTTLGYGDLTPLTLATRVLSCAEAITGQLFLTILIARLVGLHVVRASQRSNPRVLKR